MSGASSATKKVTIYTPDSPLRRPGQMVRAMFSDLWLAHDLTWRLTVRDISAQYRQAALGIAWALILPLVSALTWIFLNRAGIIEMADTSVPYPIYVFTGTMLWQVFAEAFRSPNDQVNAAKPMLSKINFPKEAIILSGAGQVLFNAVIKLIILVPVLLIVGIQPGWQLLLAPLGICGLILAGIALGLLLAPVGALYQDVARGIGLITQFWMYITPVVFPMPQDGWVAFLFRLNPLTPLLVTTRDWLTGVAPNTVPGFIFVSLCMFGLLLVGWVLYRVSMPILVERMNA